MHSSRMRTARSLTVSPYLVVSHAHPPLEQPCMPPREQPCMPPLGATMHAPQEQPCMPPQSNHACPREQPCTPPGSNPRSNHACPLPPGATMHTPSPQEQPCMPPRATTHAPPVDRMWTHASENITLPQLRCGR